MAKIIIDTTEELRNKFKAEVALQGYKSLKDFMLAAAMEKKNKRMEDYNEY